MLTPFLAYLIEHVEVFNLYAIQSKQSDESYLNQAGALVSNGINFFTGKKVQTSRNIQLSTFQQGLAQEIHDFIKKINPNEVTDEHVFEGLLNQTESKPEGKLISILSRCRRAYIDQNGGKPTTLYLELQRFQKRVELAYQYFGDAKLLNKTFNGTAGITFKTGLCKYEIGKAVYTFAWGINYYTWTGWIRLRTYNQELSAQKSNLVKTHFHTDPETLSYETIEGFVSVILRGNEEVVKTAREEAFVPIKIGTITFNILISWLYEASSLKEEMKLVDIILKTNKAQFTQAPILRAAASTIRSVENLSSQPNPLLPTRALDKSDFDVHPEPDVNEDKEEFESVEGGNRSRSPSPSKN